MLRRERPILSPVTGRPLVTSSPVAIGGENLGHLIAEVDALRLALGISRWANLRPWCDDGDPCTTNAAGLERLIERLCIVWEGRDHG